MDQTSVIKQQIASGQFAQAIAAIEAIFAAQSQPTEAAELRYMLAVALRLKGEPDGALQALQELLTGYPEHARGYQERGYLFQQRGDVQQAAIGFFQATKRNPALITSWRALIPLYRALHNPQAERIARQQVEQLEALPPAILQARDLMYEGQLHVAEQLCRQFLQQDKTHPEAMLLLAEIGVQLKIYNEAEFLLETLLELHPTHLGAGLEYLKLLAKMGKFALALALADRMLATYPTHTVLQTAKATALVGIGAVEEAISLYRELLTKEESHGVQLLLGHALKAAGKLPEAINSYQRAYALKPEFGDAYWSLANTKTYRFSNVEITQMQEQLARDDITVDDRVHINFALAKGLEDAKEFSDSFDFYAQGNALKQEQIQYNPDLFSAQVDAQIATFTPELFAHYEGTGSNASAPIFVVGLPRAGSTLLEQILASHSQVDGTMELHNILGLASRLQGRSKGYPQRLKNINPDLLQQFGEQYIKDTQVYRGQAPFFIDKMPNNFLHIGLIKLILPKAKIIDARRDPMACCFSGFKQLFGEGQEFSYSLENIGRYYNDYQRLMAHWDSVLPDFVLRVQHEDVVDDLATQVRRILDFCHLPFEQGCIDFYKTQRLIKTPSSEQVRQPIYRSAVTQWQNFAPFLQPLRTVLAIDEH